MRKELLKAGWQNCGTTADYWRFEDSEKMCIKDACNLYRETLEA